MNEKELVQDDEISLFDLLDKLRSGWRYVVGGTVLGVALAGLMITITPPRFEAVAVIQVGQVGQLGPIEPPTQAVERMKTSSFQMAVAQRLANKAWIDDLQGALSATSKYIALQVLKASPALIELKVNADSADAAKKIAEAVILELAIRQTEIAKPMVDKLRQDLSIAKEKLLSAEKELDGLNKMIANVGVKDDRFTQISLITTLRVQKEEEVFGQRQAIMGYETALMPPATQEAKAIEPVFVVDKPVSPKKTLMLALGLLGGLLAGVVSVFFVDAWRRAKERR